MRSQKQSKNLKGQVLGGIAWVGTSRGLIFLIHFLSTVVLARLLEPIHFGIYGIALIFTGLAVRLGNIGLGLALVQRKEITDAHISTVFTVNLAIFPFLTVMLMLSSVEIGAFFENAQAGQVLQVLALMFLCTPFSSVSRALMQKNMNFKGPAMSSMGEHVIAAFSQIILAVNGFGVWSLVYGHLLGVVCNAVFMVWQSKWVPKIKFCKVAFHDLFSFGIGMFGKTLLMYASDKVDVFIVGKSLGPAALGIYEKAFNLMEITVKELATKVGMVLFSAFSTINNDRGRLVAAYKKVLLLLSLVCFPIFLGLIIVAPIFINVVFGEKWMGSVLPLQILCVGGAMRMHLRVTGTLLNAVGKVASEVKKRGITLGFLTIGCWFGSNWGIPGVATVVVIATVALSLSMMSYVCKSVGMTWKELVEPHVPAIQGSMIMGISVLLFQHGVEGILNPYSFGMLFSLVGVGGISYLLALWIFRQESVVRIVRELGVAFPSFTHKFSQ